MSQIYSSYSPARSIPFIIHTAYVIIKLLNQGGATIDNTFSHGKKILPADDEPELLKMVTAILADEGFRYLVTALNRKEGIAAAKAQKPDLAVLDVMLPDGDGFSMMEQIRTWTAHQGKDRGRPVKAGFPADHQGAGI